MMMTTYRKPIDADLGQGYGANRAMYQQLGQLGHNGYDFPAEEGTPVYAARGGVVVHAGWSQSHPWITSAGGIAVLIEHADGWTGYAHLSALGVKVGDKVKVGQLIGRVGKTGLAGDYHLHFERIAKPLNFANGFAGRVPVTFTTPKDKAK